MKKRNKFSIFVSLLSLILIVGSLAVLLPSSAAKTECEHPRARIVSRAVVETGEVNEYARRTEYRCDECGEILVQSSMLDDFKNYLPGVKDGTAVFSGNWSVGYISAVTGAYKPFNAQANANGWLCMAEDVADIWAADSHGAFRFASGLAPSFGLSSRTNDKISVCFTAPKEGVVAIDFTAMRTGTLGNLRFDIVHNGKSLLNGGMELFSENCDSLEELNAVLEGVRLPVSEGDDLYFTFSSSAGNAILDGTFVSPRVEYVDTPFTVMTCERGCKFSVNGVCTECGFVREVRSLSLALDSDYAYSTTIKYLEGMTWRDLQNSLFAREDVMFNYYLSNALSVGIKSAINGTTIYVVHKSGVPVEPGDLIDPAGDYTFVKV